MEPHSCLLISLGPCHPTQPRGIFGVVCVGGVYKPLELLLLVDKLPSGGPAMDLKPPPAGLEETTVITSITSKAEVVFL